MGRRNKPTHNAKKPKKGRKSSRGVVSIFTSPEAQVEMVGKHHKRRPEQE